MAGKMIVKEETTVRQDTPQVALSNLAAYLAEQEDVAAAYLFGSLAVGRANRLSDVDVAVLLAAGLAAEAAVERQLELSVALNAFANCEVQVTLLNIASPQLAYQVVRDGRLLVQRDPQARIAFEVRAMKQYFDLQPMLAAYDQALARRIQEVGLGTRRRRHSGALDAAERIRERLARAAGH